MRVLFASKQHFDVGGVQASTDQLATRLIAAGHEVAVVAELPSDLRIRGSRWVGMRRVPGLGYQAWGASRIPPNMAMHWARRLFRPDVAIVNGGGRWFHDWTRPFLDASVGIPTALYVRDFEALEMLRDGGRRPDLVLANAEAHATWARELGLETATVPSVIEADTYRTATTGEYCLFINPVPLKGLDIALDLARGRPDIAFMFQEAWSLSKSRWQWLTEETLQLGNVVLAANTSDPSSYYGRARVVLAPYHDLNRPRVIGEAQVSGIPALALDDPAMREAVGPGGVLIPPGATLGAWLEGLSELWDDGDAHARYAEAARRYSQRPDMDPEVITAKFVAAIEDLGARRSRPIVGGHPVRLAPRAPSTPTVSVIVPARNASGVIDVQLGALAAQTYRGPWEVVVADNGSTDDTAERARAWADRVPGLRVIDASGRQCVAHARNVGMGAAQGELLLVCDADDEVDSTWVERMANALRDHHLVTGAMDRSRSNRSDQYRWIWPALTTEVEVAYGYLPFAAGGNLGLRRGLLGDVGGFDERLRRAEDIDFSWRAWYAGYRVHFVSGAVIRITMRSDLSALARTWFRGGVYEVLLYRRHRHRGMQPEPDEWVRSTWTWLLRTAPRLLREPGVRYEWVATASKRTGRLVGSVRHRALFL